MPVPHTRTNFGDLLDPRFQKIFADRFARAQLADMLPQLYSFPPDNGREDMRWSDVGAYGDIPQFTGSVNYQSATQGYDTTATHLEFASGVQVERSLFEYDQYNIMDQRPAGLASAVVRTRQTHGARMFTLGFSVDTFFYNNSENVALFSNSHTTNAAGVSTANGFDNLAVSALSATALSAARIQMVGFRDDVANRIAVVPDEIWIPPDLYEIAYEIVASMGKVDTAENNRNVHEGAYRVVEWNYLSDANDWFLVDSSLKQDMVFWIDSIPVEFAFAEDLDTLIAKWRLYGAWSMAFINWRWGLGSQVS